MKLPIDKIWRESGSGEEIVRQFSRDIEETIREEEEIPSLEGTTANLSYSINSFWDYICYTSQKLDRKDLARNAALEVTLPLLIERYMAKFSDIAGFIASPYEGARFWLYCQQEYCRHGSEYYPPFYEMEEEDLYHELQMSQYKEAKETLCDKIKASIITSATSQHLVPALDYYGLKDSLIRYSVDWLMENAHSNLRDMQETLLYLNGDSPWMGDETLAKDLENAICSAWHGLLGWNSQYSLLELINGFRQAQVGAPDWEPEGGNGDAWCSEFIMERLTTAITDMNLEDEREEDDEEDEEDYEDESEEETEEE